MNAVAVGEAMIFRATEREDAQMTEPTPAEKRAAAERQRLAAAERMLRSAGFVENPDGTWSLREEHDEKSEPLPETW